MPDPPDDGLDGAEPPAATADGATPRQITLLVADERLGRADERGDDDAAADARGHRAAGVIDDFHQHAFGVDMHAGAVGAGIGEWTALLGAVEFERPGSEHPPAHSLVLVIHVAALGQHIVKLQIDAEPLRFKRQHVQGLGAGGVVARAGASDELQVLLHRGIAVQFERLPALGGRVPRWPPTPAQEPLRVNRAGVGANARGIRGRPIQIVPALRPPAIGVAGEEGEPVAGDLHRLACRTRTRDGAGLAMSSRHGHRQHGGAVGTHIVPGDDRDFLPSVPIDIPRWREHRVQSSLVERHIGAGVPQQLGQLAALIRHHGLGEPILALHQHVVEFVLQVALFAHAGD